MTKYPQIHVPEKYQQFLQELTKVGKPSAVDRAYIRKLGFKSSYDDNFLYAIKFLGLVEDKRGGSPTERWIQLRGDFGGTLAVCLKEAYSELFAFYPDAHLRDDEALTSFFRGSTESSADEVDRMVNGFNAVRQLADFKAEGGHAESQQSVDQPLVEKDTLKENRDEKPTTPNRKTAGGASVNINIQLQLPADATGDIYDKFFEAMKKHLSL